MQILSQGTQNALVRIQQPKKEAGTATLKVDNNIWNYLPKVSRTIKIPSSMMMASWMGSHFTNDDLVKDSQLVRDYFLEIAFEGDRDGAPVYEFLLTPRPEAPVVWGENRARSAPGRPDADLAALLRRGRDADARAAVLGLHHPWAAAWCRPAWSCSPRTNPRNRP